MRILFVADGRSPTALNWMRHFSNKGDDVYLASLYDCSPDIALKSLHILPFPLGRIDTSQDSSAGLIKKLIPPALRTKIRQELVPSRLHQSAEALKKIITDVKPDIVHALRIPYEGMTAAMADPDCPLLISVWGNDFTLHAVSNRRMGALTSQTMKRVDALLADCQRDIRLAKEWGLAPEKPTLVLPGGGGINSEVFYPPKEKDTTNPTVINPRGLRSYVRNDAFFAAIPLVLEQNPNVRFICPVMLGEGQPEKWVRQYAIEANVELLPHQTSQQMAELYRKALVAVSPSEHDGTPNTLLEAMACACFPVAGDIESVREWLTDNENGLLVDPADPKALANAILTALDNNKMRKTAIKKNLELIGKRAEYQAVMKQAEKFYSSVK